MSLFITEAFTIGIKEGLKLAIVWLVFSAVLKEKNRAHLMMPFYLGLFITSLLSAASFLIPLEPYQKDMLLRLIGYTFFVFFISAVIALYQWSGTDVFGGIKLKNEAVLWAVITMSTVFYFAPDITGSFMFLRELSVMKERYAATYASFTSGFILPLLTAALSPLKRLKKGISGFFGVAQLLLFLCLLKLIAGGIKGLAELSLVPAVQRGVMKFFHDFVHQTFVFLMVPDHPLLKTTVWNFIGIFFGPNTAMTAAVLILILPPFMLLWQGLRAPLPEFPEMKGAERRRLWAGIKTDRIKKALPLALFISIVLIFWFSGRGEEVERLYNPRPLPVVEDKGQIIIPLTGPTMNLFDGRIHKFSFASLDETINIIIIQKPDKPLAVCLDACEICPPEGYGQTEGRVVCIYCLTPIPISTLGRPGGCNPIPLKATITERDVRIDVGEMLAEWKNVKTGKTKEAVK